MEYQGFGSNYSIMMWVGILLRVDQVDFPQFIMDCHSLLMYKSFKEKKICCYILGTRRWKKNRVSLWSLGHTAQPLSQHNPNTDRTFRGLAPKGCAPVYHWSVGLRSTPQLRLSSLPTCATMTPSHMEPEQLKDSREYLIAGQVY